MCNPWRNIHVNDIIYLQRNMHSNGTPYVSLFDMLQLNANNDWLPPNTNSSNGSSSSNNNNNNNSNKTNTLDTHFYHTQFDFHLWCNSDGKNIRLWFTMAWENKINTHCAPCLCRSRMANYDSTLNIQLEKIKERQSYSCIVLYWCIRSVNMHATASNRNACGCVSVMRSAVSQIK